MPDAFSSYTSYTSWSTSGYSVGNQTSISNLQYSSVLSGGASPVISQTAPSNITPQITQGNYYTNPVVQALRLNSGGPTCSVNDIDGNVVVPSTYGYINMGSGTQMTFDPTTKAGQINPAVSPLKSNSPNPYSGVVSYTGSDVKIMIGISNLAFQQQGSAAPKYAKQLIECTTLSISIHREKAPVRALGYINPKGFTRGTRTIAGTMVMTQFTVEVLMKFLQSGAYNGNDLSKDSTYLKVDQLPPFDMSIFFSNEQGYASSRSLLGVQFVTDGVVYSIQDMLSEQTVSFMCEDFTPLLPVNMSSVFNMPKHGNPNTSSQPTPMGKVQKYGNVNGNPSQVIPINSTPVM